MLVEGSSSAARFLESGDSLWLLGVDQSPTLGTHALPQHLLGVRSQSHMHPPHARGPRARWHSPPAPAHPPCPVLARHGRRLTRGHWEAGRAARRRDVRPHCTHVAAGLMYLPTPWRYVWGPWLPGLGWWVFPVFSGAASSSCVVLRCSAICDGARRRLVRSPAGWAGSPQPLPAWCPPHLSVGLLVGVHKHRGEVDADLLLAAERGK